MEGEKKEILSVWVAAVQLDYGDCIKEVSGAFGCFEEHLV